MMWGCGVWTALRGEWVDTCKEAPGLGELQKDKRDMMWLRILVLGEVYAVFVKLEVKNELCSGSIKLKPSGHSHI